MGEEPNIENWLLAHAAAMSMSFELGTPGVLPPSTAAQFTPEDIAEMRSRGYYVETPEGVRFASQDVVEQVRQLQQRCAADGHIPDPDRGLMLNDGPHPFCMTCGKGLNSQDHVANGDIGTQVATKQPGTDPRVDYIFLCRWFDVSASGQSLTVTAPILHPLANNTFKQLFTTWVVGRIRDVTSGTVAAALDPPIDAGGQENRPIEVWPKFAIPSELTDYAAPNFVIPLNPFADEPGDYQVRVDLDGVRIASLPLRLEGFG